MKQARLMGMPHVCRYGEGTAAALPDPCPSCDSSDGVLHGRVSMHRALCCSSCGRWVKWVGRDEAERLLGKVRRDDAQPRPTFKK